MIYALTAIPVAFCAGVWWGFRLHVEQVAIDTELARYETDEPDVW